MFLLPIKFDRVSFETKGRQNLQKTADFLIESIVFCPLKYKVYKYRYQRQVYMFSSCAIFGEIELTLPVFQ